MTNVFDYVKSASYTKKDLSSQPDFQETYNPYVVNKAFSLFVDTIFYANQMNCVSHLSKNLQYQYYINTLRPKSRFTKWVKRETENDETIELLSKYFGFSISKARVARTILSDEDIDEIKIKTNKGGVNE